MKGIIKLVIRLNGSSLTFITKESDLTFMKFLSEVPFTGKHDNEIEKIKLIPSVF